MVWGVVTSWQPMRLRLGVDVVMVQLRLDTSLSTWARRPSGVWVATDGWPMRGLRTFGLILTCQFTRLSVTEFNRRVILQIRLVGDVDMREQQWEREPKRHCSSERRVHFSSATRDESGTHRSRREDWSQSQLQAVRSSTS